MPAKKSESVWDYPRPPRLEPTDRRIQVIFAGEVIADSTHCYRILETSHPPVYYIPIEDIRHDLLVRSERRSFCEFKGQALYWSARVGERVTTDIAWSYSSPPPEFAPIRGHLAFYASRADECYVDGERVAAQPGDFYGGWITADVEGPFKGGPGTLGW